MEKNSFFGSNLPSDRERVNSPKNATMNTASAWGAGELKGPDRLTEKNYGVWKVRVTVALEAACGVVSAGGRVVARRSVWGAQWRGGGPRGWLRE